MRRQDQLWMSPKGGGSAEKRKTGFGHSTPISLKDPRDCARISADQQGKQIWVATMPALH